MQNSTLYRGSDRFVGDESFYVNRVSEPPEGRYVYHTHDFMEICYVAEGRGCHLLSGRRYEVRKGDLFLINFDCPHTFIRDGENGRLVTYNIVFKPDFLDVGLMGCGGFRALLNSYLFKSIDDTRMIREDLRLDGEAQREFDLLIGDMYREYAGRRGGFMSLLRAYLIELIVNITRCLDESGGSSARGDGDVIDKVLGYLQENYQKSLNLEELSLRCFLSRNYFCRLFKNATGMTMSQYVQMLRVDEVCRLLEETEWKIGDISAEAGFGDEKFMRRVFREQKGVTPGEYRRQAKTKSAIV